MLTLRRCIPADGPALLALFLETIRTVNAADYGPEQVAAWAWDEIDPTLWSEKRAAQWTLVAEEEGRIRGFAGLLDEAWLEMFFVAADAQRRGVGRRLMEGMLAEARRRGWKRIESHVSLTARPFFERFGFEVVQPRVFLHRGVEMRNFLMGLDLPASSGPG